MRLQIFYICIDYIASSINFRMMEEVNLKFMKTVCKISGISVIDLDY